MRSGLLFAGLLALFLAWTYVEGADLDPTARDQSADLSQAIRMREHGELTDGSRSPLFTALLAPFARREPGFFVDARLVALAVTGLTLLAFFLAVRRTYSSWLALAAAAVLLIELRFQARRICPEPLTALLLVLATAVLAHLPIARRPRLTALWGGALLGLAWLAKGTALLSLGAALAWVLTTRLVRGGRLVRCGLLLGGFALAASPLIASNVARGTWLLANASADHVMWEDRWDQDLDRTSTATPWSYVHTHSTAQMAERLGHGLLHQKAVEWVYAFLALLLLAAVFRRRAAPTEPAGTDSPEAAPRRAWRALALWSCALWLLPIAWYEPVVASRRFLFPIVPLLIPPALDALARLLARVDERGLTRGVNPDGRGLTRGVSWLGLAAVVAACVVAARQENPWGHVPIDDDSLAVVARLSEAPYRGATVLAKPSRTIPPDWLLEGRATLVPIPAAIPARWAEAWIPQRAGYVLLNPGLLRLRPDVFGDWADYDEREGLRLKPLPSWVKVEWLPPDTPRRYALLRVTAFPH